VRSTSSPHHGPLSALGLAPEVIAGLERYLDLLAAWNRRVNLTGAEGAEERVGLLVAPVIPVAPVLLPGSLLDVGSGNGSPGLVLSLLRPDLRVGLLEPRQKRWAFLREAARAAGRAGVEVLRVRHDGYAGPPATNVTLRALRLDLPALRPLLAPGGRVVALGSPLSPADGFQVVTHGAGAGMFHVAQSQEPAVPGRFT